MEEMIGHHQVDQRVLIHMHAEIFTVAFSESHACVKDMVQSEHKQTCPLYNENVMDWVFSFTILFTVMFLTAGAKCYTGIQSWLGWFNLLNLFICSTNSPIPWWWYNMDVTPSKRKPSKRYSSIHQRKFDNRKRKTSQLVETIQKTS